jgi:hypothetical protein
VGSVVGSVGLLPYAALALVLAAARRAGPSWGDAVVRGAIVFGVLVVLGTELLSALSAVAPRPVAAFWVVVAAGAWVVAWRAPAPSAASAAPVAADGPTRLAWTAIALTLALTLLVALVATPNSWDGMTYHLPRVVHWMAERSVRPYATSIDRQLWMSPWAEFLNLQAMVLAGGSDRLAALPAWLAFAGCIVLAAVLARRLGAGRRGAAVAALLVATAPTAVVQATATKTELPGAFWILATAVCAVAAGDESPEVARRAPLWAALAVGLAVATKGTGLLFAAPWLVVLGVALGRRAGAAAVVRAAVVAGLGVLVLNAGAFARNLAVYGDPLGDPVTRRLLAVDPRSVPLLVSNLVATASLHLATPWKAPNDALAAVIDGLHRAVLGQPARALHPYFGGFRVSTSQSYEAIAPSLVLFVLGIAASVAVAAAGRARSSPARAATAATWGGFLLFVATIRWQPYGGRLLLPTLVCLAPIVGLAGERALRGWRGAALVALSLALAMPALLWNDTRALLPWRTGILARSRADGYFVERAGLAGPYRRVLADLDAAGCERVALAAGYDSAEYPLWALGTAAGHDRTFEHVLVQNPSAALERPPAPDLCALVALDRPADWRPDGAWAGARLRWRDGAVSLWTPPGAGS